jgi:hypothetical protein
VVGHLICSYMGDVDEYMVSCCCIGILNDGGLSSCRHAGNYKD